MGKKYHALLFVVLSTLSLVASALAADLRTMSDEDICGYSVQKVLNSGWVWTYNNPYPNEAMRRGYDVMECVELSLKAVNQGYSDETICINAVKWLGGAFVWDRGPSYVIYSNEAMRRKPGR